jgi:hypothetical protein
MTLNELVLEMHNDHEEIDTALNKAQGWRGLLDPFCAEWDDSDLEQKAAVFRMLMQYRPFPELIDLYMHSERRLYVKQDLPCAIFKLMEVLPEARDFFYTSPYCTHSPYHEILCGKLDA